MIQILRAIFRRGAFVPISPCNVPENAEVRLQIEGPLLIGPSVATEQERLTVLKRVTERMKRNPIPKDAPRLTREDLHDRR